MTLSIQQIAKRFSTRSRRALITMFLSSSLISSIAFADNDMSTMQSDSEAYAAKVENEASDNALDYWIFSDDYCGWASAETFANPYAADPFAISPARNRTELARKNAEVARRNTDLVASSPADSSPVVAVENLVEQTLAASQREEAMAFDLNELAKNEPIDVATNESVRVTSQHAAKLSGSSPVIVTIAEGYLPYDLDKADLISLRMYPITIPRFDHVGVDRLQSNGLAGRGPLDCLGQGVIWTETVMPSVSVETNSTPDHLASAIESWNSVQQFVTSAAQVGSSQAAANQAELASTIVAELQPGRPLRQGLSPIWIGQQWGATLQTASTIVQESVVDATRSIATWNFEDTTAQSAALAKTAGADLLVRAGIEADALDCATAGVADVANSMNCPVERTELAAQPPATFQMAAVGVAAATLSMPLMPQDLRDDISRAEAIATACQSTAATLERLAGALRRAGDSVVRVARASAEGGTGLR